MDLSKHLSISYYKTVATINESHKIYLVQHQGTGKIYVKKILDIYNLAVYENLMIHPIDGIPGIIDFCETDGKLTLIEEYISGQTMQELISSKSLTPDKITRYLTNLCEIIEQLHAMEPPIIHRDIKPSNIIVSAYDKVFLLDFNAAKYYSHNSSDTVLLGTQGYAAPEQYGFGSSSPQTDIYSICVLLKELSHSLAAPVTLFDSIIERGTQIDPSNRYGSASELKNSIVTLTKPCVPSAKTRTFRDYLLPGYRTSTPWKILLSSACYLFILWLSLSLQIENTYGLTLWIERIFCFLMFMSLVLVSFNYCGIHRFLPLSNHKNKFIRLFGILLSDIVVVFILFLGMLIIENILSLLP